MVVRLLVGALLLVAFAGVSALLTHRTTHAGGDATLTVNSAANSDDGECEGAPNPGTGNCTLREAINTVNDGDANKIMFHPAVFGTNSKGVISVGAGLGGLPTILAEVTIDATNRGVILDGDVDGDDDFCDDADCRSGTGDPGPSHLDTPDTDGVIGVIAQHHGFDFALIGGGNFVIRNVEGAAVEVTGDGTFSLGHVAISGIITKNIGDERADDFESPAVHIFDALSLNDISVTDSNLEADGNAVDIATVTYPNELDDSSVMVTGNRIIGDHDDDGGGDGVNVDIAGDLGSSAPDPETESLSVVVNNNSTIQGGDDGVDINYCEDVAFAGVGVAGGTAGCDLERSNITFEVSGNGMIAGGEGYGIDADIYSGEQDEGDVNGIGNNSKNNVTVNITDNGTIDTDTLAGVDSDVFICCGDSNNTSTVNVSGNDEILGTGEGIEIDNSACCGNHNHATTNVTENADITGATSDGINTDTAAGGFNDSFDDGCCDGDENLAETHIDDNQRIDGSDGDGVDVFNEAGLENGNADGNEALVSVDGNGDVDGGDDHGIHVDNESGSQDDDGATSGNANDNHAATEANDNGRIHGDDSDGIDLDTEAGSCLDEDGCVGSANGNAAENHANGNESVDGESGDGIELFSFAGAFENGTADHNTATAEANDNGDVEGSDDGVDIQSNAIASDDSDPYDADSNHAEDTVNDNGRITGHDGAGVFAETEAGTDWCCKHPELGEHDSGKITIDGNERIRGEADSNDSNTDAVEIDANVCCDENNQNVVEISNNGEIYAVGSKSGDGIYVGGDWGYEIDVNEDGIIEEGGICCSTNIVKIEHNALIRGEGDDASGINYVTDPIADISLDNVDEHESYNILTVTDNLLRDSGSEGISICCGIFDSDQAKRPQVEGKSVISHNIIFSNDDDGIRIDSSSGLNIGPANVINNNGLKGLHEPFVSGGPPNDNAGDGIQIDYQIAWEIWDGCSGPSMPTDSEDFPPNSDQGDDLELKCPPSTTLLLAHGNRITQNSIYDNAALGIDLVGLDITDEDGDAACDPFAGKDEECLDGGVVGCEMFSKAEIDPNDCLPYPVIRIIAATDKVAGDACPGCTVELFLADATPANQTGPLNRQFGEGRTYLGSGTADQEGKFSIVLPCGLSAGDITATATDKIKNTSEFSANSPMLGTRTCAPATNTPAPTNTTAPPVPTNTQGPPQPTNTQAPPVPTNTPVPPTATQPAGKACGDVNDDGHTNSVDATILLQLKAGLIDPSDVANLESGDVNGDGDITSVDAALVLQLEAGQIHSSDLNC